MPEPAAGDDLVYGTLVALGPDGVLLRGPSGAGKSDLALQRVTPPSPWQLVADDQIRLTRQGSSISGRSPAAIAGVMEVRGVGIVPMPFRTEAKLRLIVDLVSREDVPRMPAEGTTAQLLGLAVPLCRLHAFDATTPAKIGLLLHQAIAAADPPAGSTTVRI